MSTVPSVGSTQNESPVKSAPLLDIGTRFVANCGPSASTAKVFAAASGRVAVRWSFGHEEIYTLKELESRLLIILPPRKPGFWKRLFTSNKKVSV